MRKVALGATTFGVVLSLMVGSGLTATLSDSVTSPDNNVSSGQFEKPSHDLQVATMSSSAADGCSSAGPYGAGPVAAVFENGSVDLNKINTTNAEMNLCLKNAGKEEGALSLVFANVSELDFGGCEPSESEAGDSSCLTTSDGELSQVLDVLAGSSSACCSNLHSPFNDYEQPHTIGTLAPGEVALVHFVYGVNPSSSETDKLKAQTDRLQWDILFTLQDVT
jgi:hypothetical protein